MTVGELIDQLKRENRGAQVLLELPPSWGENARPCEGIGLSNQEHVVLWANLAEDDE